METVKIGIIGCGEISKRYIPNTQNFEILDVHAVSDVDLSRAKAKSDEFNVPCVCSVDDLIENPEIEIVVNLTPPQAHFDMSMRALQSGKHVYSEKPIATEFDLGKKLIQYAGSQGLYFGCAPDTFMGGGLQTCRQLVDDGVIGEVVAGSAFVAGHVPESVFSSPELFFSRGAGPLLDMGPYLITALINLIGPVAKVIAMSKRSWAYRDYLCGPNKGKKFNVEIPTHISSILEFENGAIVTMLTSFDVWATKLPSIELYGSNGVIEAPNPNTFGGPVNVYAKDRKNWSEIELINEYITYHSRGIGIADMAYAIKYKRECRASGELAVHVLDVICSIIKSSEDGKNIEIKTTCERPCRLPIGLKKGYLDE